MKIHKEGFRIITIAFLLLASLDLALAFLIPWLWLNIILWTASLIFFILIVRFFRVPSRQPVTGENLVVSPCDGKVVVIEEVEEKEYFKDKRIQISVFMSPLNVHVNWYPISGKVKYGKYHPGRYLVAWHPKSSTENERTTVVVEKENGIAVLTRQIAGAVARRIIYYFGEGQQVEQCGELGFIRFGSRLDIFVPIDAKIKASLGDKVVGSETILAEL